MKFKSIALGLILALFFSVLSTSVEAKRGGGSSSRSSSSRSSFGKSSSSSSKSSTSKSSSSKSGLSGSSSRTTTKPAVRTKAESAAYAKAAKSGTAFKTKAAATTDFKSKYASKYPSKYEKEPAKRPEHIPATTKTPEGKTTNITYNSQYGGYGYMGPSGSWMAYSVMSDAVMVGALMSNRGYYYDRPPTVVHHEGAGVFGFLIILVFCSAIVVFAVVVLKIS